MGLVRMCGRTWFLLGFSGACAGLFWLAGAPAAWAGGPAQVPPMLRAPESRMTSPPAAGLRVFIDPLTGELTARPTPQQAGELSQAIAAFRLEQRQDQGWDREGPRRFELSGGGTGVFLNGRLMTSTVVSRGPDGQFHFGCTRDPLTDPHTHPDNPAAHGAAPVQ